jgi:hypothetical protein
MMIASVSPSTLLGNGVLGSSHAVSTYRFTLAPQAFPPSTLFRLPLDLSPRSFLFTSLSFTASDSSLGTIFTSLPFSARYSYVYYCLV